MKKLAVTGLTGKKSGGAFLKQIVEHIDSISTMFTDGIVAIARETSNMVDIQEKLPGIQVVQGNMNSQDFWNDALVGVDTCVHIAGIDLSTLIVRAAAVCGVHRLILVHTTGIYSRYKQAGEGYRQIDAEVYRICKEKDIVLSILRPTMIYGNVYDANVVKFIGMVDKFPLMPVVNGANYELQPVHYEDLAKAYYSVLMDEAHTGNKDFVLSGKQPIMLRKMFLEIGKNLGKDVHFINCPFGLAYFGAWVIYLLTFKKKDFREKVQRLCEPRVYSHDEATEIFGYAPVSFEDGIVDEVKQYKANKGK